MRILARTSRSLGIGVVAIAMLAAKASADSGTAKGVSAFVQTYECTVAELPARIHGDSRQEDRFPIVVNAATGRYVQCLYFDHDRQICANLTPDDETRRATAHAPALHRAHRLSRLSFLRLRLLPTNRCIPVG